MRGLSKYTIKSSLCVFIALFIAYNNPVLCLDSYVRSSVQMKKYLQDCGIGKSKLDKSLNKCNQIILVRYNAKSGFNCRVQLFDKKLSNWNISPQYINGIIGKNGVSENKREGDGKTPKGVFSISYVFGSSQKPRILKMPYRQATKYDYWIDDVSSKDYNQWVRFYGNPYAKWKSFEKLYIKPYRYGIAVDYNTSPITKGKGSAIFLHIRDSFAFGTSGCIGVSEADMVKILSWLDKDKHPLIIIC